MTAINQYPARVYDIADNGDIITITDPAMIWVTIVKHELMLRVGESPFFALNGIAAEDSIITQQEPDYYVNQVKSNYQSHFKSFVITKISGQPLVYNIALTTLSGQTVTLTLSA